MSHPLFDAALTDLSIAVFDLETTGLFPSHDRIIQMAVVQVDAGAIGAAWQQLVHPGADHLPLREIVVDLTGITDTALDGQPDEATVLPVFADKIGTRVVAGHNVKRFDIPFVGKAAQRHGIDVQTTFFIDTLKLMRRLHPDLDGHKLADCATHYGLTFDADALHDALVDTQLCAQVMLRQFEELAALGTVTFSDMIDFLD